MLVVAGIYLTQNGDSQYITEKVESGVLDQIVSVNGAVESNTSVDLRFGSNGTVEEIFVQVGEEVTAGKELARLDVDQLQSEVNRTLAGVQIQQAELDLMYAGPTFQEIQLSKAKIHEAEINVSNSIQELENVLLTSDENVRQAALNVDEAEVDLDNAEVAYDNALASQGTSGAQSESDIDSAYEDAQPEAENSLDEVKQALDNVDLLLGIDDDPLNVNFDTEINDAPLSTRTDLNNFFNSITSDVANLEGQYNLISANWTGTDVEDLLDDIVDLLEDAKYLTDLTHDVLELIETSSPAVQTDIDTLKTSIEADQASLSSELTSLLNAVQAITGAKLGESSSGISSSTEVNAALAGLESAKISLEIAESGLQTADVQAVVDKNNAEMDIDLADVRLEQRQAEHNQLIASPREVDIAAQSARVAQAQAIYEGTLSDFEDGILVAPTDGVVSRLELDVGENVSSTDIVANFITEDYQVTANISETDIAKISLNNEVSMTLDAFPIDREFSGKVVSIDPAETVIQGAVYYEATILFDEFNPSIKPGMTVNIDVLTDSAEGAIQISPQAVQYEGDETFVFILKGGDRVKRVVETGLEGERKIEILSGLEEGETIILYER